MTTTIAGSRTASARLIGALFLAGFLCYGIGFAVVNSVAGGRSSTWPP